MKKVPRYWNSSSLDEQATFFPIENRALRFGDADPHASGFTRRCKPPQYTLQVLAWNGQQDIICKELGWIPVIPKVSVVGLGGCVGSIPARVIPKTRNIVFPCLALSIWTCTLVVTHTTRTIRAGVLVKTCGVCNAPIFSDKSKLYTQHPTKLGVFLWAFTSQCLFAFTYQGEQYSYTGGPTTPFHLSHFNVCHLFFFCAKFFGFLLYPRSINYLLSSCRSPGNSVIWAMAIFTIWLHEIDQ